MPKSKSNSGTIPFHRLFGTKLGGRWTAFGCHNQKCGSVWMVRTRDMKNRLKIQSTIDGQSFSTMPCPVCFRTGRIE